MKNIYPKIWLDLEKQVDRVYAVESGEDFLYRIGFLPKRSEVEALKLKGCWMNTFAN